MRVKVLGVVALAFALGAAAPAPAVAAMTGVQLHTATSDATSANKSVTVTCPAGTRVVGAGANLFDDNFQTAGQFVFGAIRPDSTLTSVTALGREGDDGLAAAWRVRADAVCAPAPPGLQRVAAASPRNSNNKSVTASCPAGKRLLGFGADVDGGGGEVAPNDIIPGSGLKSVTVTALEDADGTPLSWIVRAYAICSAPVAGLERIAGPSTPTSFQSPKSAGQVCPAGKQLLSAGTELAGDGGNVVINRLLANPGSQSEPQPNGAAVFAANDDFPASTPWSARSFAVCAAKSERRMMQGNTFASAFCPAGMQITGPAGEIAGGVGRVVLTAITPTALGGAEVEAIDIPFVSPQFTTAAYAICATPLPGLELVSQVSANDSSTTKSIPATCPAGKRVVGAGGSVDGGGHEVALTAVLADPGLTGVAATGIEDFDGYGDAWVVTAFAVCADPPPGLEFVAATTDPQSDTGGIAADCPSGKNLLGSGAGIAGTERALLDDMRPNATLTRTTATALEDRFGTSGTWTLTAQAICASP